MGSSALVYALFALLALGLACVGYTLGHKSAHFVVAMDHARERALEALGAGMIVIDGHGLVSSCNPEARLLLGFQDSSAADGFRIMAALRDQPDLAALLVAGEGGTELILDEEGARRRIEARAFPLGDVGRGTVLLLSDVTENAALLEELAALASLDALTGAFNRRRFDELGERDIELSRRAGKSVGVLMLDIDFFKKVNDSYGHSTGDQVLRALCESCRDALRSTDVLARYGGEEFAVLLPGSEAEDSIRVAERLRARIAGQQVACEGGSVSITVSIGAYSGVPAPGENLAIFLRRADEALYRSKAMGRDQVSYWKPLESGGRS